MISFLEQEIMEQPAAIQRLIDAEQASIIPTVAELMGKFNYVLIAARGTSDNAARYAQYLFQIVNHIPVALATPSVFSMYQQPPKLDGALAIGISQSGQSPDIVSVLTEARKQGRPTIAVTNEVHSPLAQTADVIIPLQAGTELAVAATKTYTTSLTAMALLSYGMSGDAAMLAAIRQLPVWVEQTLALNLPLVGRMERFRFMEHGAVIGRGYNYATAFEIALKVKELTGVTTVPYSSADFLHGPVASVKPGYPVLAIAHQGVMFTDTLELIEKADGLGAELVVISDSPKARALADLALPIPEGIPEWLSPVVDVLPGQILGWQMAVSRGLNPDKPKGLSKVTETL
ncbi:MAG: SIS domain-containing protein [Anaerolineaceae bacterium]